MLTKNFYYALSGYIRRVGAKGYTANGFVDADGTALGSVDCGTTTKPASVLGAMSVANTNYYKTGEGVVFGTGTTPPTVHDYEMDSPITGSDVISVTTPGESGVYVTIDDVCMRVSTTYDVTNLTEQELAISEIGLFGLYRTSDPLLYDHTVLDEPIIVPAGQTMPITYEIKFPYGV